MSEAGTSAGASPARPPRALDVDVAKGLGIILVVLGHVVAREIRPVGNAWYAVMHEHLYSFHMAFFFYLSGYVYFLRPAGPWWPRWQTLARRLVPAYVLFAAIVFVAKMAAALVLPVDRKVGALTTELAQLVTYPTEGYASFLWFIVVLLQIQWVTPWLLRVVGGRLPWALAVAAVLHALSMHGDVTKVFALHQLARYLLFFLLAGWVVQWRDQANAVLDRWTWIFLALLAAALALSPPRWEGTLAGLASLPALHALARRLVSTPLKSTLVTLGAATLTIYLMNSLALGLARGLLLATLGWDHWRFFIALPVLLVAGLVLPIVVQRLVFSRVPWLDRITK